MSSPIRPTDRRAFLGALSLGAAFFTTPGLFAEELARTPACTEGPFYPDHLPLDADNDLIVLGDSLTPAVGEITQLHGRILDLGGSPIKDAVIEIWQCDANGVYLHSADSGRDPAKQDKNFQGFGRFTTGTTGEYRFRTIKPVVYSGRPAPHIHFKIKKGDRTLLTSQIFIDGHPGNQKDGVLRGGLAEADRKLLMTTFKPIPDSKTGELAATFDVILGRTLDDRALHAIRDRMRRDA
ncbi:protocatechuate 3,4-dioxygenase [Planctomyces sp. SH-PL62]|uniref:dioxygenase family protein n=1 Tax=Planctomyces sp. SH-PL62 TaxID=1636152 RepID=UPI00078DC3E1|nr:protocatechuate 3,4-dioxygenase [Planctomyces sp. SH-PL62]AMV38129.1 Protocatechuate 3,4-dioxygenase beta chain [Planctomyces sp. SH-PL62]